MGVDRVFSAPFSAILEGKKVGLITNQTGVNGRLESTISLFRSRQKEGRFELKALFAPEHGLFGDGYGDGYDTAQSAAQQRLFGIPVYPLYGKTRRPTSEMLAGIDLLVFDIQDIGCRSYTFAVTLFYAMEEAAKRKIAVLVLDRPNPINGLVVDGPLVDSGMRSFLSYLNIPYCHGMTIGELARFFNEEYEVRCQLQVVPMLGWNRSMCFDDTRLAWIPTSPNIPEATTCALYPATGLLGEMKLVSIGIGYTLPFKVVGAPWIDAERFCQKLNSYGLPSVRFYPIRFRPFLGRFVREMCQGTLIVVSDQKSFLPVTTQYALLSALRELHPKELLASLTTLREAGPDSCLTWGTQEVFRCLAEQARPFEQLHAIHQSERERFLEKRKKYLLY